MVKLKNGDISYKELLVIDADGNKHTCECLGIRDDHALLFIKEREANVGNVYYLEREFYLIDRAEYFACLGIAAKNIRLQRSISKGEIVLELCYKGIYFHAGSSVSYIISHKESSVFTSDTALAQALDFSRIDKFEYEKTVRIAECDAVKISHMDAKSEAVLIWQEFTPSEMDTWLDTLA